MLYKAVRRSIILFALGLFVNNGYYLETFRVPGYFPFQCIHAGYIFKPSFVGVLQRFAVAYLAISLIIIFVPKWNIKSVPVSSLQVQFKIDYPSFF
jgi:hypothetical protein